MSSIVQSGVAMHEQPTSPALPSPPMPGEKARKDTSTPTRRIFWILISLVLLVLSIGGFYILALRADDTISVLITAQDIAPGTTVTADLFTSANVVPGGGIEYVDGDFASSFEGLLAIGPIPAGTPARYEMFQEDVTVEEAGLLEVVVPLDLSLSQEELSPADYVLLIDPGIPPGGEENGGIARYVVESRYLDGYEEGQLRLNLPPEEWSRWRRLVDFGGRTPQVMRVNPALVGNDDALNEWISRLNDVFTVEFQADLETYLEQQIAGEPDQF